MYRSEWTGSTDPGDESGVATFTVDNIGYTLRLEAFSSFQLIGEMLDSAFEHGARVARQSLRSRIMRAMDV